MTRQPGDYVVEIIVNEGTPAAHTFTATPSEQPTRADPLLLADGFTMSWSTRDDRYPAPVEPTTGRFNLAAFSFTDLPELAIGTPVKVTVGWIRPGPWVTPAITVHGTITDITHDFDPHRRWSVRSSIVFVDRLAELRSSTPDMSAFLYWPMLLGWWHSLYAIARVGRQRIEWPASWPVDVADIPTPWGQFGRPADMMGTWPAESTDDLVARVLATPPPQIWTGVAAGTTHTLLPYTSDQATDPPAPGQWQMGIWGDTIDYVTPDAVGSVWDTYGLYERQGNEITRWPSPETRHRYSVVPITRALTWTDVEPPYLLTQTGGLWSLQLGPDPTPPNPALGIRSRALTVIPAAAVTVPTTAQMTRSHAVTAVILAGDVSRDDSDGDGWADREEGTTQFGSPWVTRYGLVTQETRTMLRVRDERSDVETRRAGIVAKTAIAHQPDKSVIDARLAFSDPFNIRLDALDYRLAVQTVRSLFPTASAETRSSGIRTATIITGIDPALGLPRDDIRGFTTGGEFTLADGIPTLSIRLAPGIPQVGPEVHGPITFADLAALGIAADDFAPDVTAADLLLTRKA